MSIRRLWNPFRSDEQYVRISKLFLSESVVHDDMHKCLAAFDHGDLTNDADPRVDGYRRCVVNIQVRGEDAGSDGDEGSCAADFIDQSRGQSAVN